MFRRFVLPGLKVIVAAGLLYYVIAKHLDADSKRRLSAIFLESPAILFGAAGVFSLQILLGAQRVRILLASQGVRLSYFTALRLTYIGAFFDTFGVTSVGGDAVKAIYLAREAPEGQKVETVSVLLLDRLMGLWGLLTLAVVMSLWEYRTLQADPEVAPHLKFLFIVPGTLLLGTGMLLSESVYMWAPMQAVLRFIPLGRSLDRAYGSLQKFGTRPLALLAAWSISLVVHVCGVMTGYILMRGINENASVGTFFVAWFVSNFVISFAPAGGIGFGQYFFDKFFKSIAGMDHGWILATAVQATCMLGKLPGLVAWLLTREHRVPALQPNKEKVAT